MLKTHEIFKKRVRKKLDIMICVALLLLTGYVYMTICTDKYTAPLSLFLPPTEITAGEPLEEYYKKQVTCEIPYVLDSVVNFYDSDLYDSYDENVEFYTHGYVGLDENMENPFFFFVPPDKKEEVDRLKKQTRQIIYDGEPKRDLEPIRVTGYVRMSKEKHFNHYKSALTENYGNADLLKKTYNKVYVLDDENVSFGSGATLPMEGKLFSFSILFALLVFWATKVSGLQYERIIKKHLNKYRIDDLQLNQELAVADEIAKDFWVGKNYIFFLISNYPYLISNGEMVLVYATKSPEGSRTSLNFYTLDKRRYSIIREEYEIAKLLRYFEENYPRVVVGIDEEIHRMLIRDFDAFLDMKYRKK
ncbi:MAG: hypothetical protein IJZ76_08220 [Lachnospiraceae bacterium]|nr:hypothetical protein [Lachnospiraceae bacterium]